MLTLGESFLFQKTFDAEYGMSLDLYSIFVQKSRPTFLQKLKKKIEFLPHAIFQDPDLKDTL